MRLTLLIVAAPLLTLSTQVEACMSVWMPQAVLFDEPPSAVPKGYKVFKIRAKSIKAEPQGLLVEMLDIRDARSIGPSSWIDLQFVSSCTVAGRLNSPAYVVARKSGQFEGRPVLRALAYWRSGWDKFWDYLGRETYTAGEQI